MKKPHRNYQEYLRSAEWLMKKAALVNHYKRQKMNIECGWCGSTHDLQVHHRHYRRIFRERMWDLVFLCRRCHEKETANKGSFGRYEGEELIKILEAVSSLP